MSDDSRFLGRLNVSVQPAYVNATREEILSMTLTARGEPLRADTDGVLDFLDMGHNWIVRGFTQLTTPKMHELWGRSR
jgi:hypothetical protein